MSDPRCLWIAAWRNNAVSTDTNSCPISVEYLCLHWLGLLIFSVLPVEAYDYREVCVFPFVTLCPVRRVLCKCFSDCRSGMVPVDSSPHRHSVLFRTLNPLCTWDLPDLCIHPHVHTDLSNLLIRLSQVIPVVLSSLLVHCALFLFW